MGGHGHGGGEAGDPRDVDEATASYDYLIKMKATNEEMERARVPLEFRDQCAHRLIPLNKCRLEKYYLPWHCNELRHAYEKCEYFLILARIWQAHLQENVAHAPLSAGARQPVKGPLDEALHTA